MAKSLGLNALNFHRNIARAESLDAADQMGLLRYTEPGGGMTLFWDKQDTGNSFQKYMTDKIAHMVRDARSHPSLTMYVVQNELDDTTYKHPLAPKIVRLIHAEDPSRVVLLKSGINAPGEMWMMPYDDTLYVDDGTGYSGWFDTHSVGTPDAWTDADYRGPDDYVYRNTDRREIVDYGEMGGSGCADNHALMIRQIHALGGGSYDLLDHEEIDAAYNRFLDQYGFRASFPTTDALYRKIGEKQYDYWEHVLQAARLSDTTDYLTVSGWETTAVENHGGIVDNLRNPHGDPRVIGDALRPVMPDLQVRTSAVAAGETSTYDLFFLNESNHSQRGVSSTSPCRIPAARLTRWGTIPYRPMLRTCSPTAWRAAWSRRRSACRDGMFSQPLSARSARAGRFMSSVPDGPRLDGVAVAGASPQLLDDFSALGQPVVPFDGGKRYAVAVCSQAPQGSRTTSDTPVSNTAGPGALQVATVRQRRDAVPHRRAARRPGEGDPRLRRGLFRSSRGARF